MNHNFKNLNNYLFSYFVLAEKKKVHCKTFYVCLNILFAVNFVTIIVTLNMTNYKFVWKTLICLNTLHMCKIFFF